MPVFFGKPSCQSASPTVIKNTLYIFAGRSSNAVFLFLLALVVSRQLGPALFGIFSFLTVVVVAANCFSNLGLDTWMIREVTKTPSQGKLYPANILGLKIGTFLIIIMLIFLVFRMTNLPQDTLNLLWILSISLFVQYNFADALALWKLF